MYALRSEFSGMPRFMKLPHVRSLKKMNPIMTILTVSKPSVANKRIDLKFFLDKAIQFRILYDKVSSKFANFDSPTFCAQCILRPMHCGPLSWRGLLRLKGSWTSSSPKSRNSPTATIPNSTKMCPWRLPARPARFSRTLADVFLEMGFLWEYRLKSRHLCRFTYNIPTSFSFMRLN